MSAPQGRRLICCFDGTGNEFGDTTNVVDLFGALRKDNPDEQLVYYQTGIGTYTSPLIATPIMMKLASFADQAVAWYLDEHVKEGYLYLMQNYRPGDRICLFGFSRGAYTARCLAGMLHKVGLLPRHNDQQMQFAFKLYKRTDKEGWKQSEEFKKTFTSHDVTIEFVGVWDTVCSVGFIPYQLPFTSSNYAVNIFRQALSLDERRCKFLPNTWNTPTAREATLGRQPQPKPRDSNADDWQYEPPEEDRTDVLEVWFSGCHADVGGGSTNDNIRLARISLAWMVKQCSLTKSGILFDDAALKALGINPKTFEISPKIPGVGPISTTSSGSSSDEKYSIAKIFDQLVLAPFWWFLEIIPLMHSYYERGYKYRYVSRNFGTGRYLYHTDENKIKVHNSVKERMNDLHDYFPGVQNFDEIEDVCEWVD
ncbi:hypothetical protein AX15_004095 [Amanita polypyramis BW_CC]|nr:hypothetical protein AX15_004095 [Amanita polypyramis BW_CC]